MIIKISIDEWNNEIYKYLWLLDKENFEFYIAEENRTKIGEVSFHSFFENKLYCKGIYVQKIDKKEKKIPGFKVYDLTIDRDRNSIKDIYEMKKQLAYIFGCAFNINKKYSNTKLNNKKEEHKKEEHKKDNQINSFTNKININIKIYDEIVNIEDYGNIDFTKEIISVLNDENILSQDSYFFFENFLKCLNTDKVDKIWRIWEKENNIQHLKIPKYQPADSETINELRNFLEKNKLKKDFYLYFQVKNSLMKLLKKSSLYIGYEKKFE